MFKLVITDDLRLVRPLEHGGDLLLGLVQGRLVHLAVVRRLGPIVQLEAGGQVVKARLHIIRSVE